MQLHFHELVIAQSLQINGPFLWLAKHDLINTTTAAMTAVAVVALADVMPIRDVDTAIGSVLHRHPTEPRIIAKQEVFVMNTNIGRSTGNQLIAVDAVAVQVCGKQLAAVSLRPVVAEVRTLRRARLGNRSKRASAPASSPARTRSATPPRGSPCAYAVTEGATIARTTETIRTIRTARTVCAINEAVERRPGRTAEPYRNESSWSEGPVGPAEHHFNYARGFAIASSEGA